MIKDYVKELNIGTEPMLYTNIKPFKDDKSISIVEAVEVYKKKQIPEDVYIKSLFEASPREYSEQTSCRHEIIRIAGFPIITKKLCRALAEFIGDRKVLEVMSGLGCLAKGLRDEGVEIKATDNFTYDRYSNRDQRSDAFIDDIENIDAVEAVNKYGKGYDLLLISWAPYGNPIDYKVLTTMRSVNKDMEIIWLGESVGGCCGSDEFFNNAECIEDDKINEINKYAYRQHDAIHDNIYLYK